MYICPCTSHECDALYPSHDIHSAAQSRHSELVLLGARTFSLLPCRTEAFAGMRKFAGLNFDRALDGVLDGIERRVRNAADVLEEYPAQASQDSTPAPAGLIHSSSQTLSGVRQLKLSSSSSYVV